MRLFRMWDEFWFSPVSLRNLGIFRFLLCSTLGLLYAGRQDDVGLFFTDAGILPRGMAFQVLPEFYRPMGDLFFWSDQWMGGVHLFFVIGLFLLALGIGGRGLNIILAYLNLAFLQRNFSVAFGADQIGAIFLCYLALTKSCGAFSLVSWFQEWRGGAKVYIAGLVPNMDKLSEGMLTSVGYRLIQLQICVIYMYSGFEKLRGATWWDGTALWSVFANPQMVVFDMLWTRHFPWVISAITFSTIIFEIYFPVLVWFSRWRKWFLLAGVGFHLGIAVFMGLYAFAAVMASTYILFLSRNETHRLLSLSETRLFR